MFLCSDSLELDSYHIHPESRLLSDHTSLSVEISIIEEVVQSSKFMILPKSDQEKAFINEVISNFKTLSINNINDSDKLDNVVHQLGLIINQAWKNNAKKSRLTKHSKQWWSDKCGWALQNYRTSRSLENWKNFKRVVKNVKRLYFDEKIQEIANKRKGPWELTNWINRHKLPATETIKHNGQPCLSPESLWDALHGTFNTAQNCPINIDILNKIDCKLVSLWNPFSKEEFKQAIVKYNDSLAPRPDKLLWRHLKSIVKQDECLVNIINIANACINLGHWLNYFKCLSTIIIPKLNKLSYDQVKMFHSIVLLNTLGKLTEKVITKRVQFIVTKNNFIHLCQLGGLKHKSTIDVGVALTHIVRLGWTKGKTTSTLAFDILQFFPSLNHHLLMSILYKAGLEPKVTTFFVNYLVQKKTNYVWNNLQFPDFEVNVGVGQESALSPILSTLYLTLFFYILEKRLLNLNISISMLSFVDNRLIIAQNRTLLSSNSQLFCSYNVLLNLLSDFGLVIEHGKTEVFHFNRSHGAFNPPSLNLSLLGGPILHPKDSWKYLGFFFDWKLTFCQHIDFYSNKAISMVKYIKLLGNLSHGISPIQKQQLYRCCVLPIALYGFQLWFYNKAPMVYHIKLLNKMQRRAAIWILGAFKTSSLEGIKAIVGIIPIKFHLQKLTKHSLIRPFKLPENHIVRNLMDDSPYCNITSNPYAIRSLTNWQRNITKGHIIDANIKSYGIFPSFNSLH